MIKLNVNAMGLAVPAPGVNFAAVAPGASGFASVPLVLGERDPKQVGDALRVALKEAAGGRVVFFNVPLAPSFRALLSEEGAMAGPEFGAGWKGIAGAENEATDVLRELATGDTAQLMDRLARSGAFFHVVNKPGQDAATTVPYYAARMGDARFYLELTLKQGFPAAKVTCKSPAGAHLARLAIAALAQVLRQP